MYLETFNDNLLSNLNKMNFKIYYPIFKDAKFKFANKQVSHDVILKNF